MLVVVEGVAVAEVGVDAADGQVHLGQPPGGVVGLLAVDGDVAELAAVGLDELLATGRTCRRSRSRGRRRGPCRARASPPARAPPRGRVELAALLAFGAGELRQEVFVDLAQRVLGAIGGAAQGDVADQVDELAQALLVQAGAAVVLGQHAFERGIVALDGGHGVVDQLADAGLRGVGLEVRPARLLRHPEDAGGAVFVGVLGIGAVGALRLQLGVLFLEGVGDVLEEDQAEDDVLVLGRVHVVAQGVGRLPELGLEAEVGGGAAIVLGLCHEPS